MLTNMIYICLCLQFAFGRNAFQKEQVHLKKTFDAGSEPGFDIRILNLVNKLRSSKEIGCGISKYAPNTNDKITGGVEAIPHSWPWQVSIQQESKGDFFPYCGATIITTTKMLSASHCFVDYKKGTDYPINNLVVVAGIQNTSEVGTPTSQTRKIARVISHPYIGTNDNVNFDISIIVVDQPFIFEENVQPACLPTSPVPDGTYCYSTGWGGLSNNQENTNQTLRQVRLQIYSIDNCTKLWDSRFNSKQICAGFGEGGFGSCHGDSGGPFVCHRDGVWVIDGIISYTSKKGCGHPEKPTVFTRVSQYVTWIKRKL